MKKKIKKVPGRGPKIMDTIPNMPGERGVHTNKKKGRVPLYKPLIKGDDNADAAVEKYFALKKPKTMKLIKKELLGLRRSLKKELKTEYENTLRVMPDFCSSGIWAGGPGGPMVDYDQLERLPKDFIKNMENWIDFYDGFCHEHKGYTFIKDKHRAFILNFWGMNLAGMLKKIYPEYKVIYWGETPKGMADPVEVVNK